MAAPSGERSRSVVNEIFAAIEYNFKEFNISEIIKGGSQGHGTGVDSSDIDLVVYSRDISGQAVLAEGKNMFKKWLIMLDEFLSQQFGPKPDKPDPDYKKLKIQPRSVKFIFKGQINVDLLVSPYFETPTDLYNFLETVPLGTRSQFTVCASKWQVGFFKKQPPQVKEYIRKAKLWRDNEWSASEPVKPSSYLVSLLVVAAHKKSPGNVSKGLMNLALKLDTIDLTWQEYYQLKDVTALLPRCPRIVDPANPANNVLESGMRINWKKRNATISRYMLSVGARKTRKKYMHHPPGLTQSEASQVLEVVTRCNAWSKRLWNEDADDEDDNGRPSMYLLFVLILKAFYAIKAEKDRLKKKRLKSYIHLVHRELVALVDEVERESDALDLMLPPIPGKEREHYQDLLPDCPRICDPVDPANNLYLTEIERQKNQTLTKWSVLKERIRHIDLSKTKNQILAI